MYMVDPGLPINTEKRIGLMTGLAAGTRHIVVDNYPV